MSERLAPHRYRQTEQQHYDGWEARIRKEAPEHVDPWMWEAVEQSARADLAEERERFHILLQGELRSEIAQLRRRVHELEGQIESLQ